MLTLLTDYRRMRAAIVQATMVCTGLDQNHVIMAEPEAPNQPRPRLPYVSLKIISAAIRYGEDQPSRDLEPDGSPAPWLNYGGPRSMVVSCNAYARSHDDAYNVALALQSGMDTGPVGDLLGAAGLAVWVIGGVRDLSMLLTTGYEGRTQMDLRLGFASNVRVMAPADIASVDVTGSLGGDPASTIDTVIVAGQEET